MSLKETRNSEEDISVKEVTKEAKINWSKAVSQFTRNTTFHGIRYIGEETQFVSRRISWVIVVLAVIFIFTYAIISRVLHFYSYPSNIELKVGYVDKIQFPTVTVCNQNPYRLTALQEYGMHDIMRKSYKQEQIFVDDADHNECTERYMLNPLVCTLPSKTIFIMVHRQVTVSVCKDLCTYNYDDLCSGFLFDDITNTCTLTSFMGEDWNWLTANETEASILECETNKIHFYRRRRCIGENDKRIYCNFEDGNEDSSDIYTAQCRFSHVMTQPETWIATTGLDNTYNKENGHYLELFNTNTRPGFTSRIQTEFMNTSGKCMILYGKLSGKGKGSINIILQAESLVEITLHTLSDSDYDGFATVDYYWDVQLQAIEKWISRFTKLPNGIHRVIVEGNRASAGYGGLQLDDIQITECQDFKENCMRTPRGVEYMGDISETSNGDTCLTWDTVYKSLYYPVPHIVHTSILLPDSPVDANHFCRYSLNDGNGMDSPFCFVNVRGDIQRRSCTIPRCLCRADEFGCSDGMCVPKEQICDGVSHCLDGSDETEICKHKRLITCDFEDPYICGYRQLNFPENALFSWRQTYDTSVDGLTGNSYTLQLFTGAGAVSGEMPMFITPAENLTYSQIITFNFKMLAHHANNGLAVWLFGSSGLSTRPLVIHGGGYLNSAFEYQSGHYARESATPGWLHYDICVPGGNGSYHSLLFQALYEKKDDFAVDSVNVTEIPCDVNLQFDVFASDQSVACNFNEKHCSYSTISDHINQIWSILPLESASKAMSLYEGIAVTQNECIQCIEYKGNDYDFVYFETSGIVKSHGFPNYYSNYESSVWLIEMPVGMTIQLTFKSFAIEYKEDCSFDSLKVEDIQENGDSAFLLLCGTTVPKPFNSRGNQIRLTFTSDNSVTQLGFLIKYTASSISGTTASALALMYNGPYTEQVYTSRLISSVLQLAEPQCLSLIYMRKTPIIVTLQNSLGYNLTVFQDEYTLTSDPDWSRVLIDLPVVTDEGCMIFIRSQSNSGYLQYSIIIDDIKVTPGLCLEQELTGGNYGTLECNFEDMHMCEYMDITQDLRKWTRIKMKDSEGKTTSMMYFSSVSDIYEENPAILISPFHHQAEETCIQYNLAISGLITVKLQIRLENTLEVVKELDGVSYWSSELMYVTTLFAIPAGSYHISFLVYGKSGFDVYVNKVDLVGEGCDLEGDLVKYLYCQDTESGTEYNGFQNRTLSGNLCQHWNSQVPHSHIWTEDNYPNRALEENYCRNPDNEPSTWCYTTNTNVRWEYCNIPMCSDFFADFQCEPLPEVPNSRLFSEVSYKWKSVANYACVDPAIYLGGDLVRKCTIHKTWSGTSPICSATGAAEHYTHFESDATTEIAFDIDQEITTSYVTSRNEVGTDDTNQLITTPQAQIPEAAYAYCTDTQVGIEYHGAKSFTHEGYECQRWDSQIPHSHMFIPHDNLAFRLENNYCRNPDTSSRPWCYTIYPSVRWGLCDIPMCADYFADFHCGALPNVINATLEGNVTNTLGSVVTYDCISPSTHQGGDLVRTCTLSKSWSGRSPICSVDELMTTMLTATADIINLKDEYEVDAGNKYEFCRDTTAGLEYVGTVNETVSRIECQRWELQIPHSHIYDPELYPENYLNENYCRNTADGSAPWCYTIDPWVRWDYCDVPMCNDFLSEFRCDALPDIQNATLLTANMSLVWKSIMIYECNSPLVHKGGDLVRTCTIYKMWSGSSPICSEQEETTQDMTTVPIEATIAYHDYDTELCMITEKGYEYNGTINITANGLICQYWDSQTPQSHSYKVSVSPQLSENYCRNPDVDGDRPWCYTVNLYSRWEYCDIPMCRDFYRPSVPAPTQTEEVTTVPMLDVTQLYLNGKAMTGKLIQELDADYKSFLNEVSYHKQHMILKCIWNGLPCEEDLLTETITDMGICVTFNARNLTNMNQLLAEKTGQLNGLRMTINVEDYEHVENIGTDSGIKVHFYDNAEIPIMKSRGYAVSTGSHALFSLKYATSEFLEAPYGTCGKMPLPSYPETNYTTSHCLMECDIASSVYTCGCVLPHMPNGNQTRICTIQEFLNCVIPKLYDSSTNVGCDCPDACHQTLYDVQLSQSTLSGLAVTSILADKELQVKERYHSALNLQHRLMDGFYGNFLLTLKQPREIVNKMEEVLNVKYIQLVKLVEAATSNLIDVAINDIHDTSTNLREVHDSYFRYLSNERMYLSTLFEKLYKSIQQLVYVLKWQYNPCVKSNHENKTIEVIMEKIERVEIMYDSVNSEILSYTNVYQCHMNNTQCDNEIDLSDLHIPHNAGFDWSKDFNFPLKTVLDEEMDLFCKEFMTIWQQNTTSLNHMLHALKTVLPIYNKNGTCEYFKIVSREFFFNQTGMFDTDDDTSSHRDINIFYSLNTEDYNGYLEHFQSFPDGIFDYWSAVKIFEDIEQKFVLISENTHHCFSEFADFLSNSLTWRQNVTYNSAYDISNNNIDISFIYKWLDLLYQKYSQNGINKQDLVSALVGNSGSLSLENTRDFVISLGKTYLQNMAIPLYTNLDLIKQDIFQSYKNIMTDFLNYSDYMGRQIEGPGNEMKSMKIFRKPKPELESLSLKYLSTMKQVEGTIGTDVKRFMVRAGTEYIKDTLDTYFSTIEEKLDEHYIEYVELENGLLNSLSDIEALLRQFANDMALDENFIRHNIMEVDIYFGELKHTQTIQARGYTVGDFFSDLGGYLGLLLGASIVTVCEVMDLIIYNIAKQYLKQQRRKSVTDIS